MDLEGRSVPEIRDLADDYYRDHSWDEVEALPEMNPDEKGFKAEVWARKAVAERELPDRLDYLEELSRDESWRVRERVAMALKHVNANAFEQVESTWEGWVDHDDNYVRRACEVGLMGVEPEHVDTALGILDPLMADDDDYVKKSCGAFAVSSIANTKPAVGREYLERWSRSADLRTRWNVAKAVGGAYRENDHALDLAYRLSGDEAYRVRRATASSLKKLFDKRRSARERVKQWDERDEFLSML